MQHIRKAPRVYITRLQRALRYAKACIGRLNKYGFPDKRYYKLRDYFDAAKQRFCALQFSTTLTDEVRAGVLNTAMGLAALMEQIEAKVADVTNRTKKLPGGSPTAMGIENDRHDSQQSV